MENNVFGDGLQTYEQSNGCFPGRSRRPVIGITGNFGAKGCELAEGYYQSVVAAGGTPLIIPPYLETDALLETLDRVDALLLSGGGDLNPLLMGEEPLPQLHSVNPKRDEAELVLIRWAADRQIPMLGICRGIQMMVYALGGDLYQDIYTQAYADGQSSIKHDQDMDVRYPSHTVALQEGSILQQLFGTNRLAVNSVHHQAVCNPGPKFRAIAASADGIIEAVESTEYKSMLGVQWHPETFILRGDTTMLPIFRWLVGEAASFMEAKRIHNRIVTLDSHCDTPMFFDQGIRFDTRDPKILVDLHKMTEGHLDASIMVAYIPQGARDAASLQQATDYANHQLDRLEAMVGANADAVDFAYSPSDLYRLKRDGKKAIMKGIENGYAFGLDLGNVTRFRHRGVVYATLCHNGDNDVCDSARGHREHHGVSDFGADVIRIMNRVGMMVDLSHASEESFYDAIQISQVPIVCSHSSCRALCDHPRNLTDDQMRALAQSGGVMQITLYNGFLRTDGKATVEDAFNHLLHAVEVMGVEHVGLGTDFDGDGGIPGLADASELIQFTRGLLARRFSEEQIEGIWGQNFLRVMAQAQYFAAKG